MCLPRTCFSCICSVMVFIHLRLCFLMLGPSNIRLSSSVTVVVLVRWFYLALPRRLPDFVLQQVFPVWRGRGDDGGVPLACFRACSHH